MEKNTTPTHIAYRGIDRRWYLAEVDQDFYDLVGLIHPLVGTEEVYSSRRALLEEVSYQISKGKKIARRIK